MILAIALALSCHPVDGDRILGRDLAAAGPAFASIDPDAIIGAAPIPGLRRFLRPEELLRIAHAHNLTLAAPVPEVCFERATEPLTAGRLLAVLQDALGLEGAKIEILDFSRVGIPRGTLEFPRSALSPAGFWRGHVTYSENRTMPLWARVRVTTEQTWIEAAVPIEAVRPIASDQLILRTGPRFPFGPRPLDSIDAAAGRKTLRAIKPGEPIFSNLLISPHDVERGEKVAVEVSVGRASISFDAVAESSGRIGETVLLRNPQSDRYFQARIESKGKAAIRK